MDLNTCLVNLLSANPTKWSNTRKQFICLSVFDHFVGLVFKELRAGLELDKILVLYSCITPVDT